MLNIYSFVIRKAQTKDLDQIKALADADRTALGFVLRPALRSGIEHNWMLVAEAYNQKIVGFLHYRHRKDIQTTLYEICVDRTWRSNGIGRSLFKALYAEASTLSKGVIRLKAPVDLNANEFYRVMGFKLVGTEPGKKRPLNIWEFYINGERGFL